jgi:hypothetical protein
MAVVRRLAAPLVLALLLAAPALAGRAPTATERSGIEFAVRFFPTVGRQNTVAFTRVRVSTADTRYAGALARVRDAHGGSLGTIGAVLKRTNGWTVIVLGTPPLRCTGVPAPVRADLGHAVCR